MGVAMRHLFFLGPGTLREAKNREILAVADAKLDWLGGFQRPGATIQRCQKLPNTAMGDGGCL